MATATEASEKAIKTTLYRCVEMLMNDSNYSLFLQKLKRSNGDLGHGISFSKAFVFSEPLYVGDEDTIKMDCFTDIFLTALDIIMGFVTQNKKPKDRRLLKTLDRLLDYMSHIKSAEQSLKCDGKDTESTWMTRITVHYLAALSMDGQFWFNKFTKKKENHCPCSCAQKILYMDTNIGNPNTWYGKLDVILGCLDYEASPDVGVMTQLRSDENTSTSNDAPHDELADGDTSLSSNDDSPGGRTQAEVKLSSLEEISQMQAQTIVFSFYQKKRHPEVGLVPSISVSKTHIQFHFYDSAKDVYLMSRRMPLFQESGNSLSKVTALATWMVVNYKILITAVTDEMEKETPFGLLTAFTPESLEYYKSGIVMADFEAEKDNIIEDRGRLYKRRNNVTAKCIKSFKKLR